MKLSAVLLATLIGTGHADSYDYYLKFHGIDKDTYFDNRKKHAGTCSDIYVYLESNKRGHNYYDTEDIIEPGCDANKQKYEEFALKYTCGEYGTDFSFVICSDGTDGFWFDYLEMDQDAGGTRQDWGGPGSEGWCLSKDPNDTFDDDCIDGKAYECIRFKSDGSTEKDGVTKPSNEVPDGDKICVRTEYAALRSVAV